MPILNVSLPVSTILLLMSMSRFESLFFSGGTPWASDYFWPVSSYKLGVNPVSKCYKECYEEHAL